VIGVVPRRRLRLLESPEVFSRACLRVAGALAIFGIVGVGNRLVLLPLAGVSVLFAALARLADTGRLDESEPLDAPAAEPEAVESDPESEPAEPEPSEPEAPAAAAAAVVSRTFRLPASVGAEQVALVGELNGWSPDATPMRREGEWFTVTVELEAGRTYRYRYLLDGERWENDWAAEEYLPNEFGTDDSVVRT
jgi:hypothetical protein